MKCAFCELPEVKKRKIIENEYAWAFPTNIPITHGHTLIIPKRCVSKIEDLDEKEIKAILDLAKIIKASLKNMHNSEGFNLAWNENKAAGQTVPHFHLHIIPRKENDPETYGYEPRKFIYNRSANRKALNETELKLIASEIKKNIPKD